MRVVIGLAARKSRFLWRNSRVDLAGRLPNYVESVRRVLPFARPEALISACISADGQRALIICSNESGNGNEHLSVFEHNLCGYISSDHFDGAILQEPSHYDGNFSTISIDGVLQGYRCSPGIEPLYWGNNGQISALSNRAACVAACLAASSGAGSLKYALDYIPEFVSSGFPISNRTPFDSVFSVPPGSSIKISNRGNAIITATEQNRHEVALGSPDLSSTVAQALVQALRPLEGVDGIELGLTGGKDSRLIAAALHAAGFEFRTRTHGHPLHPDVVVARMVADVLGVPHENAVPSHSKESRPQSVAVPLYARLTHAIRRGEGMVSAYENLGSSTAQFSPSAKLSGQGGELLRGGYGHYLPSYVTSDAAVGFLTRGFKRYTGLMHEDAARLHEQLIDPWLARAKTDPLNALDEFYLRFRAGRWSASARSSYTVEQNLIQPFFDSKLLRSSARTPVQSRVSERLIYQVLFHLNPRLVDIPFAAKRWKYLEVEGSRQGPEPISGSAAPVSSFNWRVQYGSELQRALADIILDPARDGDLFQVMRRDSVERVALADRPTSQHLIWHLATVSYMLSSQWIGRVEPDPRTVPVPTVGAAG